MKKLPEQVEHILYHLRDVIAYDPLVSVRKMQELIETNTGHSISDKYVSKLMHKVRRQAVVQSDQKKINERLAEVRERYRVMIDDLQRTICWKADYWKMYRADRPNWRERHAAIRLVAQLELALFKAELEAGVYENKQLALQEMLKQGILPTELNEKIVGVFRSWKMESIQKKQSNTNS